ncbi:MAG TPA: glycosyltransferase family 9 protein, partial [Holophaga sp.]|nr:glycosyltransferase family 9 protein [Holophaga sp.]
QWLYTHPFKYRGLQVHLTHRYRSLVEQLTGSPELHWEILTAARFGGQGGMERLKAAGWTGKPYACLAFGTRGDSKRWFPEKETWPVLARLLMEQGLEVVWLGSPGERDLGRELCERAPGSIDLTGTTTIPEAFAILRGAYGTIAIDTGLAHLSAGAGRPTVTLNSHSPEKLIQPIGPFATMLNGPMVDLFEGQSRDWKVLSPSMLRLPMARIASTLHLLALESRGAALPPAGL